MCTVLWPLGVNSVAVNKIYHISHWHILKKSWQVIYFYCWYLCFFACFTYVLAITRQPTLDISTPYSAKYCVATAGSQVIGVNCITNCRLQVVMKYCFFKKGPYIVFYLVILLCAAFPYSKCVLSLFFIVGFFFAVNFETLCVLLTEVILFYFSITVHPFFMLVPDGSQHITTTRRKA
jgi:hypothetical protein